MHRLKAVKATEAETRRVKTKESSAKSKGMKKRPWKKDWQLYSLLVIPVILIIVFRYLPVAGNIIAFRKYRPGGSIFGEKWVGIHYFQQFIQDKTFWAAFRNTFTLSVSYLAVRIPATLIFAILLKEMKHKLAKSFVQTVSYLPHFLSVVILCGMVKEIVATDGPVNKVITFFGGQAQSWISIADAFPAIYVSSGIWQALGFGSILYLAAMTNVNSELFEAARMDGANRFKQIWHVLIPGIMPTITTLLILDIGKIMTVAYEKILLLYNPITYSKADVIETYLYRLGVQSSNFSYAAAIGLFEGIIGIILIVLSNRATKKITDTGLW